MPPSHSEMKVWQKDWNWEITLSSHSLVYTFVHWNNRCLGIKWKKTHMTWPCHVLKKTLKIFYVTKDHKIHIFFSPINIIRGCFPLQSLPQMVRWILASPKYKKNPSLFQLMQERHECNLGLVHSLVTVRDKIHFMDGKWMLETEFQESRGFDLSSPNSFISNISHPLPDY